MDSDARRFALDRGARVHRCAATEELATLTRSRKTSRSSARTATPRCRARSPRTSAPRSPLQFTPCRSAAQSDVVHVRSRTVASARSATSPVVAMHTVLDLLTTQLGAERSLPRSNTRVSPPPATDPAASCAHRHRRHGPLPAAAIRRIASTSTYSLSSSAGLLLANPRHHLLSWPPPPSRPTTWSCSSRKPTKAPAWTATPLANPSRCPT